MERTPKDKIIIITGATGSMGVVATREMAREGYHVIMACRNLKKGEEVRQQLLKENPQASLELKRLDLSSQKSVREFVESLSFHAHPLPITGEVSEGRRGSAIVGLFNNAGNMLRHYTTTEDGYESTMAINYLNSVLLTRLLIPHLSPGAHIVNMVSLTVHFAKMSLDWQSWGAKEFRQLPTYSRSKLAFLYFTIALARRHPEFIVNMSDPGIVNSNMISMDRWYDPLADIFFRPFIKTPEQGVAPALSALHTDLRLKYFVGKKAKDLPSRFLNSPLIDKLWDQATDLLKL